MYINKNQMLHCLDECLIFIVFILRRFVPLNRDKPSVLSCVPMNSALPNFYWHFILLCSTVPLNTQLVVCNCLSVRIQIFLCAIFVNK